jgi:hypothetical protein
MLNKILSNQGGTKGKVQNANAKCKIQACQVVNLYRPAVYCLLLMMVMVPVFEILFPDGVVTFKNHKQTPCGKGFPL